MSDRLLKIHVVTNAAAGLVHGITRDESTALQWIGEVADRYGNDAARRTVDLVDISAELVAERRRTWEKAIEALRDEARFLKWTWDTKPEIRTSSLTCADYLESLAASPTTEGAK